MLFTIRRSSIITACALLVAGGAGAVVGASGAVRQGQAAAAELPADSTLFAAVAHFLEEDPGGRPLRVDPRPLRPDPALVSVHEGLDAATAGRVVPATAEQPFAEVEPVILEHRLDLLRRLAVDTARLEAHRACPGVLVPPSPEVPERRQRNCPAEPYRLALLALPREGAPYWPGNVDERPSYAGVQVVSVRSIVRSLGPEGASESATDYLFAFTSPDEVRFVKLRALGVVD
ncbi:MAG: hypothetical protein WEB88_05250 [Gemmatimonadota bacterium]